MLEVHPFPRTRRRPRTLDRSRCRELRPPPAPKFPAIKTATLSNGLKVYVAERARGAAGQRRAAGGRGLRGRSGRHAGNRQSGHEHAGRRHRRRGTPSKISDELARLGAQLSTGADLDFSTCRMSALQANLDASLTVFADVVRNPAFPQTDFARLQKQQMAQIQREKVTPFSMGLRVLPRAAVRQGHAYAMPLTGSGTEDSVGGDRARRSGALSPELVQAQQHRHRRRARPRWRRSCRCSRSISGLGRATSRARTSATSALKAQSRSISSIDPGRSSRSSWRRHAGAAEAQHERDCDRGGQRAARRQLHSAST